MPTARVLCSCSGLRLSFGRHEVLRGCDLVVREGEVVGLAGENGSGKSTLVKCLLGLLRADAGRAQCTPSIGYCPQENYLHRSYTVAEHVQLIASLNPRRSAVEAAYLERVIASLKLTTYLGYQVRRLSGGTYQKVKLLTAIAHRPQLLVLDEPTDGFDWTMYRVFWDLVRELASEGAGVLMVSHLLLDRERFDRIHELRDGAFHG